MAQTAQERLSEQVDWLLERSFEDWQSLAIMEKELQTLHPEAQLGFVLDWQVSEGTLKRLNRLKEQGQMTLRQRARYSALLELVEQNRPIIERIKAVHDSPDSDG